MAVLNFHSMSVMPINLRPEKFQSEKSANSNEEGELGENLLFFSPVG